MKSRFPVPPGVVGKIIKAAADPETSVGDLARLLQKDAVLSSQVLKTVNSAAYGLRSQVVSVERAVALMGIRSLRNMVLSLGITDLVPTTRVGCYPIDLFWEASLRRGAAARGIAESLELADAEEYFTIGLCQDLGILVSLSEDESISERLAAVVSQPSDQRRDAERELGEGHDQIGAAMFAEWNFPDQLTLPILHHHRPDEAPEAHRLAARVAHAAEAVADLACVEDKREALLAVSERLTSLGVENSVTGAIIDRVNATVEEYAEALGLKVQDQPSLEEIIAAASAGLAELSLSYEELTRRLQEELQTQQRLADELRSTTQELDRQARTDALTGLMNRRAFDQILRHQISLAHREKKAVSVLLLDIDHFKSINDTHGHAAGDAILSGVGRVLREHVRDSDAAARYGGEEFAVVLSFSDESGGRIAAERFRAAIEGLTVDWEGRPLQVTISCGGASVSAVELPVDELSKSMLRRADEALYEAKRSGRNRACWSDPCPVPV